MHSPKQVESQAAQLFHILSCSQNMSQDKLLSYFLFVKESLVPLMQTVTKAAGERALRVPHLHH